MSIKVIKAAADDKSARQRHENWGKVTLAPSKQSSVEISVLQLLKFTLKPRQEAIANLLTATHIHRRPPKTHTHTHATGTKERTTKQDKSTVLAHVLYFGWLTCFDFFWGVGGIEEHSSGLAPKRGRDKEK